MTEHRPGAAPTTTPGTEPAGSAPPGGASAALLAWGRRARRDLPWRRTRQPWPVLVSEVMLQQTQVARVIPKWFAFLDRFPTVAACAESPAGDVVRLWDGLGYNRRALNLHRAAAAMCERHDGVVPDVLDELLSLPGIGPYTARAVLAFAFGRDVGVLDTNAARVLARQGGRRLTPAEAQHRADAAVPAGHGWEWNQAVLDLGATICTARDPACGRCPITRWCAWRAAGPAAADPARGSAGASGRQSTFAGSDRQGRGRLVAALRRGPVAVDPVALAGACGWPADPAKAARVAAALVADGLAVADGRVLNLPS